MIIFDAVQVQILHHAVQSKIYCSSTYVDSALHVQPLNSGSFVLCRVSRVLLAMEASEVVTHLIFVDVKTFFPGRKTSYSVEKF